MTSKDYEELLVSIQLRLAAVAEDKCLDELTILCQDHVAMQGIAAYAQTNQPFPCKTLVIKLDNSTDKTAQVISELKSLLVSLSSTGIKTVKIDAMRLDEETIKDLTDFINEKQIALQIDLPALYQNTTYQKSIDEKTSDFVRNKHIAQLNAKVVEQQHEMKKSSLRPIRTINIPVHNENIPVQVELAEELQVEAAVSSSIEAKESQAVSDNSFDQEEMLDLNKFFHKFGKESGWGPYANSNQVSPQFDYIRGIWNNWAGTLIDAKYITISKTACEELVRHKDQMQFGLDFENLPPGFMVKTEGPTVEFKKIHFDAKIKTLSPYQPLQVQLHDQPEDKILSQSLFEQWLASADHKQDASATIKLYWNKLNELPYQRATQQLFKKYLPKMMRLDNERIKQLFDICFEAESFNVKAFQFLMENAGNIKKRITHCTDYKKDIITLEKQLKLTEKTPEDKLRNEMLLQKKKQGYVNDEIKAIEKDLFDQFKDVSSKKMDLLKYMELVNSFVINYQENAADIKHHLLNQLPTDLEVMQKLVRLQKDYKGINLDAILQLYIELGEAGINKLDITLDHNKEFFQNQPLLLAKTSQYSSFFSKKYEETFKGIQALTIEGGKVWWQTLLSQHCEANDNVDLHDLFNAFNLFKKELDSLSAHQPAELQKKLEFSAYCNIKPIKNLPTALSRILSCLKNNDVRGLAAQWHEFIKIPKDDYRLDLSSAGMIKSIYDTRGWGFVTSEMKLDAAYEKAGILPGATIDRYKVIENSRLIGGKTTEELTEGFFRFVACQPKNAQLNLEFYRYVQDKISEFSYDEQKFLYPLMASATTGVQFTSMVTSIEDAKNEFNRFMDLLALKQMPSMIPVNKGKLVKGILETLYDVKNTPSLPLLNTLSTIVVRKLASSIINLKNNIAALKDDMKRLNQFIDDYKENVYEGMKHYDEKDFNRPNLLTDHLNTVALIDGKVNMLAKPLLVPLISTFAFSAEEKSFNELIDKYYTKEFSTGTHKELLKILSFITTNSAHKNLRRLTTQDFKLIIETIKTPAADTTEETNKICNKILLDLEALVLPGDVALKNYFPNDFFITYGKDIPELVKKKIAAEFPGRDEKIQTILQRTIARGDAKAYQGLTDNIISVTKQLSATDKNIFINRLLISGLYLTSQDEKQEAAVSNKDKITKLLSVIMARNSRDAFVNFMESVRRSKRQDDPNLTEKTLCYLDDILPILRSVNKPIISEIELTPSLHETLLKTPINQMEKNEKYKKLNTKEAEQLGRLSSLIEEKHLSQQNITQVIEECVNSGALTGMDGESIKNIIPELSTSSDNATQLERIKEIIKKQSDQLDTYSFGVIKLCKKLNAIAAANPGCKKQLLELYHKYLQAYSPDQGLLLDYLMNFVGRLENTFKHIADKNTVLSLCVKFNGQADGRHPEDLLILLNKIDEINKNLQDENVVSHSDVMLKIAVALIEGDKNYNLTTFLELCVLMNQDDDYFKAIKNIYHSLPYPSVDVVLKWHDAFRNRDKKAYKQLMREQKICFGIVPCHREPKNNGFEIKKANKQLAKFRGLKRSSVINPIKFSEVVENTKTSSYLDLTSYLQDYKTGAPDIEKLVAVAAELMHRTLGKDEKDAKGNFKPGSSMEINTTQYLAILAMLKTPGHVASEIGTGEGKSRIMMITNACLYAMGYTVDFVTSDVQLATRDFIQFKTYFEAIGAKPKMITSQSDPKEYPIGGVIFSDAANLSLFRNKARSMGLGHLVINPDPSKRAFLLDEGDKTFYDSANKSYNFSTEGDEHTRGMKWIYPLLVEYFNQKSVVNIDDKPIQPVNLLQSNVDACRESFIAFVKSKNCSPLEFQKLKALPESKLEDWLVSAVKAKNLKFNQDFKIEPNVLINTPTGPKYASEARLIDAKRSSKISKYSYGIHQCLHAHLNMIKNAPKEFKSQVPNELIQKLGECEYEFDISDEKQIVRSSSNKNLIDDYRYGLKKIVSGSIGSNNEKRESAAYYKKPVADGKEIPMTFIEVPRHKGLHRKDNAVQLTANDEQQFSTLVDLVKVAKSQGQPVLIIAKDDKDSEKLFGQLRTRFAKIQHIHAGLTKEEEDECISKAGKLDQITVSTDMTGRGVDITLEHRKGKGLHVILTYIPEFRDLIQILGRAARFGAAGETSILLNKEHLGTMDEYYKDPDGFITRIQDQLDKHKEHQRIIKYLVGDLKKQLTDTVDAVKALLSEADQKVYGDLAKPFFDILDREWQSREAALLNAANFDDLSQQLDEYHQKIQQSWDVFRASIPSTMICQHTGQSAHARTQTAIPAIVLDDAFRQSFNASLQPAKAADPKVRKHYSAGDAGVAVNYAHWSIPVIAWFKGYLNLLPFVNLPNARKPFANTRAWLRGEGVLFADLRASEHKGKRIGAFIFGLLGLGAGLALSLTGVFAPIGVPLMGLSAATISTVAVSTAGFGLGMALGWGSGSIYDAKNQPKPPVIPPIERPAPIPPAPLIGLTATAKVDQRLQGNPPVPPVPHLAYGRDGMYRPVFIHTNPADEKTEVKPVMPQQAKQMKSGSV